MTKQIRYISSLHQFVVEDVSRKLNISIETSNSYFHIYFKTIKHYIKTRYREILKYNKKHPHKNRDVYEKLMLGDVFQITPSVSSINGTYAAIQKLSEEERKADKYMSDDSFVEYVKQLYESRRKKHSKD